MTLLTLLDTHGLLPPPLPPAPVPIKSVPVADLPHFSAPFQIGRHGTIVVEQGSAENVADNIYNIAVCPQGERDDDPQFGIPEIMFKKMPVDLSGLQEALRKYEPACDLSIEQHREGVARAGITINATP